MGIVWLEFVRVNFLTLFARKFLINSVRVPKSLPPGHRSFAVVSGWRSD